jgi:hypothetical protein
VQLLGRVRQARRGASRGLLEVRPSSVQPLGAAICTGVPGCEDDTLESDDDSQANMSLNFRPVNLTGVRTQILLRISILAFSTPMPKNAKPLLVSPSFTNSAACCHWSVGPPSVMRNTQGRKTSIAFLRYLSLRSRSISKPLTIAVSSACRPKLSGAAAAGPRDDPSTGSQVRATPA